MYYDDILWDLYWDLEVEMEYEEFILEYGEEIYWW